jgi:ferric-dicitrate binding protein FerR (iron transport regulator)
MSKEELWSQLEEKISDNTISIAHRRNKGIPGLWAIAASVVLLLGVFSIWKLFLSGSETSISTGVAETKEVLLPDKSGVFMNASTTVKYDASEWATNRTVTLEGEAFFNVAHGATFTVQTEQGSVRVLGTSFNVKSRGEVLAVACKTGKVAVIHSAEKEIILLPGEAVRYGRHGERTVSKMDTAYIDQWVRGDFYFSSVPIEEVFEELENQFDINIVIQDETIGQKQYTGFINVNKVVVDAINDVCLPLNLRFDFDEESKEVRIYK